ncbi:MAG: hypothetical protein ABR509_05980 [Candidatus Limnocylindria bacterium]
MRDRFGQLVRDARSLAIAAALAIIPLILAACQQQGGGNGY